MPFSRLSRYIFQKSLFPYAASLCAFVGLYIVLDLFSNLGRISRALSGGNCFGDIALYFFLKIPSIIVTVFPFVTAIAVTFIVLGIIRNRENIVFLSAGISIRRTFIPLIFIAGIVAALNFCITEYAIPSIRSKQSYLAQKLFKKNEAFKDISTVESTNGIRRIFHIEKIRKAGNVLQAEGFHCFLWRTGKFDSEIHAAKAVFDATKKNWRFRDGFRITYDSEGFRKRTDIENLTTNLPESAFLLQLEPEALGLAELWRLRRKMNFAYEFHRRLSGSVALFFFALLLIPAAVYLSSKGMFQAIGGCIALALVYYGMDFLLSVSYATITPLLAGWFEALVTGSLGILAFFKQTS